MTTVSHVADGMAVPDGSRPAVVRRTRAHAREGSRGSVAVTLRAVDVGRRVVSVTRDDVAGAWFARQSPPALAELWTNRIPPKAKVPGEAASVASWAIWALWIAYNHVIGVPLSAVGYAALWVSQHPLRALAVGMPLGALLAITWIAAHPVPTYR